MKIQSLLLTVSPIAITAKAPGDFLRVDLFAGSVSDQMRILTEPNDDFDPVLDIPSIWKGDGCESVEDEVFIDIEVTGCCEIPALDGFFMWREDFNVDATGVKVDFLAGFNEPKGTCDRIYVDDRIVKVLPPGSVVNSYVIQAFALDRVKRGFNYLMEFHNQEIVALITTNGVYQFVPGGPTNLDILNNPIEAHLDISDMTFFHSFPYEDPRETFRGVEPNQPGVDLSRERYAVNCEMRPMCGTNGDPHFKTWMGEHFEYHGQCDMVLAKDNNFAEGLGIDIHIRTKIVRFWSYIKNAVIRIGHDILEIQGSSGDGDLEYHYWMNYEYQGELSTIGGFPISVETKEGKSHKTDYIIDLGSKYPNQKIVISTYKEFIKVEIDNPTKKSFGNAVGMMGSFETGATVGRDGVTVLDDFTEYGNEWQVLPADHLLFHERSEPQFPTKCLEPEDPRGERRRRLDESRISMEEAEAACASLKDPLTIKECVYDILATQDMGMVGAF